MKDGAKRLLCMMAACQSFPKGATEDVWKKELMPTSPHFGNWMDELRGEGFIEYVHLFTGTKWSPYGLKVTRAGSKEAVNIIKENL